MVDTLVRVAPRSSILVEIWKPFLGRIAWNSENALNWRVMLTWYALVGMFIDHVGLVFPSRWSIATGLIGMAMPIMAFNVMVGCELTRDWRKYLVRLLLIGCAAQPFYIFVHVGTSWFNEVFSLAAGIVAIQCEKRYTGCGLLLTLLLWFLPVSLLPCLMVWGSYVLRKNDLHVGMMYAYISLVMSTLFSVVWLSWSLMIVWVMVPRFINVPKLKRSRTFFYSFYPIHWGVLWLLKQSVNF